MARTPPGGSWEAYADRQIREAQARGEFAGLAGEGQPLPDLHRPRDGDWWIKRKLRDEEFVAVPPALQLRREVEAARGRIATATTEAAVRAIIDTVNAHIRHANATIVSGPPSTVWPLDVDREVQRWRATRPAPRPGPQPGQDEADEPVVPTEPARSWWSRLRRARSGARGSPG